jgi:hypothetical protein
MYYCTSSLELLGIFALSVLAFGLGYIWGWRNCDQAGKQ